jgi:UDP-N-acetylglucosamine 2-epimerase (non-hydrolysing)
MKKVLLIFGTRPEAIKMAPIYHALSMQNGINVKVVVTAQHRDMLDQVLDLFGIIPDYDLNIMRERQDLFSLTSALLESLKPVFEDFCPDIVLVHGDTTTTLAGALASYYKQVEVGHVEAGLRTGNIYSPWPEELNRKIVGSIANLHFAPTKQAKSNLINENVPATKIHVTGNTVIDALFFALDKLQSNESARVELDEKYRIDTDKRLILVTTHRRENFGVGLANICEGLKHILKRPDVQILFPVHPNPDVKGYVEGVLKNSDKLALVPPLDYLSFVHVMERSTLILTDSGGVQEEAPSLGKPVLVLRDSTERPEALIAGTVKLVGVKAKNIHIETELLLENDEAYGRMARACNPYGDGLSSQRIIKLLS